MKCKDCGSEMVMESAPETKLSIKIPFSRYTLELWDWAHEVPVCMDCLSEKEQSTYQAYADGAAEDGYKAGYKDGLSERGRR